MPKTNYRKKIDDIGDQIKALRQKRCEYVAKWVERDCPYQEGDVIEIPQISTIDQSLVGKSLLVDSISLHEHLPSWGGGWGWVVVGFLMRSNGKPSRRRIWFRETFEA